MGINAPYQALLPWSPHTARGCGDSPSERRALELGVGGRLNNVQKGGTIGIARVAFRIVYFFK